MSPALRSRSVAPVILHGASASARARPWSGDPTVGQLTLFNQSLPPAGADVRRWLKELAGLGFTRVRTGALGAPLWSIVESHEFVCVQELALLEHPAPAKVAEIADLAAGSTTRLLSGQRAEAAEIDREAFGPLWGLDVAGIDDVCGATTRHRARAAVSEGRLIGYAISGRDGRRGFLQRLAVQPQHQRHGVGLALVTDALRWAARWHLTRVLVNTHVENTAALALYHRLGFVDLPDGLRVYERALP